MVMNGFDIDFDNENDIYAVNFIPFYYVGTRSRSRWTSWSASTW